MDDWLSFEGSVVPMEWGDSVYTVLPLPQEVSSALQSQNAKRVEIELNDHPLNLALTKAPVIAQVFVYTGKNVLMETGIAPGEMIDVRLRKADPNVVDIPPDVTQAIFEAGLVEVWTAMTPGKKRGLLHPVSTAKRLQTRQTRIAKLVKDLSEI